MDKKSKILILSPHADDLELSMGGTVKYLTDLGCNILSVVFSPCFASNTGGLYQYLHEAYKILGITESKLLRYEVRKFTYSRQEILEDLAKIRQEFNPDIVYLPSSKDLHQDHEVIHKEGLRAFENRTVLGYSLKSEGNFYIPLDITHIEAKIKASNCYIGQSYKHYFGEDYLKAQAMINGSKCNAKFAESFEIIKMIL